MRYWLHKISHHQEVARPLLEKEEGAGFLTIGFSDVSNPEFLSKALSASHVDDLDKEMIELFKRKSKSRFGIWRFLHEMKPGDRCLVPSYKAFSIYEIASEPELIREVDAVDLKTWNKKPVEKKDNFLFVDNNRVDLGFFRRVKLHQEAKNISRADYADRALTARMKIWVTNEDISDLEKSINTAVSHHKERKPLSLYSPIMEQAGKIVLENIYKELTPEKFERLVAWYFRKIGASEASILKTRKKAREGVADADVIATFESIKTLVYAQVKFHAPNSETNEWALEQIEEYCENQRLDDDDDYSKIYWVVSTAKNFSEACVNRAKETRQEERMSLSLINGEEFARLLIDAGLEDLDSFRLS